MERELNEADLEILHEIKRLQTFVNTKMRRNEVSDMSKSQLLINDIQIIHLIWRTGNE